jgi:uridine phosphorylase
MKLKESELILNGDGSIYHLRLKPGQISHTVIIVGDPQRVDMVSSHFSSTEFSILNREFFTRTGLYKGKRLTVLSTGMGTDNIDIVVNELDALVNIDFERREIKPVHTSLNIIRIGTSGAVQADIPLNSYIVSGYGLGMDGLIHFYDLHDGVIDREMTEAFIRQSGWPGNLPRPYIVGASEKLASGFDGGFLKGITLTAPGFYGPQGRMLRLGLAYPGLISRIGKFSYHDQRILNFEMETSALYGLGKMLGHETLTVCLAIANRERKEYSRDYKPAMTDLITRMLDKLT